MLKNFGKMSESEVEEEPYVVVDDDDDREMVQTHSQEVQQVQYTSSKAIQQKLVAKHAFFKEVLEVLWSCAFCTAPTSKSSDRLLPEELFGTKAAFVAHFARTCHICRSRYTCPATLGHHRARHASREARHVCNVCEIKLDSREQFDVHKRTHKPYRCVGCGQVRHHLDYVTQPCDIRRMTV